MYREELFKAADAAGLTRITTCCDGVKNKLCANDAWQGDLGAFAAEVERRTLERAIAFIRNGSFLHDQAPPKLFANEVTAEMEKQLFPQVPYLYSGRTRYKTDDDTMFAGLMAVTGALILEVRPEASASFGEFHLQMEGKILTEFSIDYEPGKLLRVKVWHDHEKPSKYELLLSDEPPVT